MVPIESLRTDCLFVVALICYAVMMFIAILSKRLKKEVRMSVLQRQCMIIVTLLGTLLLLSVWPRFLEDALSVHWAVYVLMIAIAAIPLTFHKSMTPPDIV